MMVPSASVSGNPKTPKCALRQLGRWSKRPGLDFTTSWQRRSIVQLAGVAAPVIGLKDLITAKEAAGRSRDLLDLQKLCSIKE